MFDTDCDADLYAADPNAAWWSELLADLRTPDPEAVREALDPLLKAPARRLRGARHL